MFFQPRYKPGAGVGPREIAAGAGAFVANKMINRAINKAIDAGVKTATRSTKTQTQRGGAEPLKGRRAPKKRRAKIKKKGTARLSKDVATLKKQISDLKHTESASLGTLKYRYWLTNTVRAANNAQAFARSEVNTVANYESVLAQLQYYNPSLPGTLTTADGTTGSYQKEFLFKNVFAKLLLRNNYQSDAEVIVYLCKPKQDTSINVSTSFTNAITDDAGNVSGVTDYGIYPTDFDGFRDNWTAKRVLSKTLSPGESCEVSHSEKDIFYDPAFVDSHNLAYQKGLKHFTFATIVRGVISHDTVVSTEQGVSAAGVDLILYSSYEVKYDAGVNLSFIYQDTSNLDTPTNGFVQSQKPVADNQSYSIT